jgi:hypothetical protein
MTCISAAGRSVALAAPTSRLWCTSPSRRRPHSCGPTSHGSPPASICSPRTPDSAAGPGDAARSTRAPRRPVSLLRDHPPRPRDRRHGADRFAADQLVVVTKRLDHQHERADGARPGASGPGPRFTHGRAAALGACGARAAVPTKGRRDQPSAVTFGNRPQNPGIPGHVDGGFNATNALQIR